jgi:hypothetical protein
MGGVRVGILGTHAGARDRAGGPGDILGGGDPPGVLGVDARMPTRQDEHPPHTDRGAKPRSDAKLDTTIK